MINEHFKSTIAQEELYQLPLKQFQGKIHLIESRKDLNHVATFLKSQDVLGFDTETKPSFRKGKKNKVALMQLSTSTEAFLFRMNRIGMPPELKTIMEDDNVLKVGAAIRDDIRHLKQLNHFEPAGFIELQEYVKEFGIENYSLKKMSGIVLHFRISKSQRLTNWEGKDLSDSQMIYAATDAWVCHEIYLKLRSLC